MPASCFKALNSGETPLPILPALAFASDLTGVPPPPPPSKRVCASESLRRRLILAKGLVPIEDTSAMLPPSDVAVTDSPQRERGDAEPCRLRCSLIGLLATFL